MGTDGNPTHLQPAFEIWPSSPTGWGKTIGIFSPENFDKLSFEMSDFSYSSANDCSLFQIDIDGNGFSDAFETTSFTGPNDADTDEDRTSDGREDKNFNGRIDDNETDPTDSKSHPTRSLPWLDILLDIQ